MKMRMMAVLAIFCSVGAAWGDPLTDVYDASTGYVTLSRSDEYSYCSFTNSYGWSDGKAPHSDTNYFIGRAHMRTPKDNKGGTRFQGKKLVLRTDSMLTCAVNHPSSWEQDLTFPDVDFIRGYYMFMVAGTRVKFEKARMLSSTEDPFRFVFGQGTTTWNSDVTVAFGELVGAADASLKFENNNNQPVTIDFILSGDFSNYYGQLVFRNQANGATLQNSLGHANVHVGTGCVFKCTHCHPIGRCL